jgi:hypothetical protein
VSADLHEYPHDTYGPSLGAHPMELAAEVLHDALHDLEHGEATQPFEACSLLIAPADPASGDRRRGLARAAVAPEKLEKPPRKG